MPGSVETTLTPPNGIIDPDNQRSSVMVMVVVSPASIVTSVTEGTMLHDAMRSVARRKRKTYFGFISVDTAPEARSFGWDPRGRMLARNVAASGSRLLFSSLLHRHCGRGWPPGYGQRVDRTSIEHEQA